MASDFQHDKISAVFTAMDADGDGFLTESDFLALSGRWAAVRGEHDHARLTGVMMGWWVTLRAAADEDGDDRISLAEVMSVVDALPSMLGAVTGTADAMFEAIDEDGDGRISQPEYRRLIQAWNGRLTDTDAVFPLLDLDGDGYLSRTEFRLLWQEFWAGDDPGAPGTWVFGRFPVRSP